MAHASLIGGPYWEIQDATTAITDHRCANALNEAAVLRRGPETGLADRLRYRHRETRLLAATPGLIAVAEKMEEHDRSVLARQMMEQRINRRRIEMTPKAEWRIVEELGFVGS